MVNYRRNLVPGGTYFFTVTLRNRNATTLIDHVDVLRAVFRDIKRNRPFIVDAVVILPDHLHSIWTLPAGDADYAGRWRAIKSGFTRALIKKGVKLSRNGKGEYDLWQRRYWEHTIRNEADMARHVEYIHFNPVKHAYVTSVVDWKYSSFHHYVRQNIYPANWSGAEIEFDGVGYE